MSGNGLEILLGIIIGFPASGLLYLWNKKKKPKDGMEEKKGELAEDN